VRFGKAVNLRGIDTDKEVVKYTVLAPATQEVIDNTVAVMGGEDWQMWIDAVPPKDFPGLASSVHCLACRKN
jgi:trans-2-enoyl-CoA reductase